MLQTHTVNPSCSQGAGRSAGLPLPLCTPQLRVEWFYRNAANTYSQSIMFTGHWSFRWSATATLHTTAEGRVVLSQCCKHTPIIVNPSCSQGAGLPLPLCTHTAEGRVVLSQCCKHTTSIVNPACAQGTGRSIGLPLPLCTRTAEGRVVLSQCCKHTESIHHVHRALVVPLVCHCHFAHHS